MFLQPYSYLIFKIYIFRSLSELPYFWKMKLISFWCCKLVELVGILILLNLKWFYVGMIDSSENEKRIIKLILTVNTFHFISLLPKTFVHFPFRNILTLEINEVFKFQNSCWLCLFHQGISQKSLLHNTKTFGSRKCNNLSGPFSSRCLCDFLINDNFNFASSLHSFCFIWPFDCSLFAFVSVIWILRSNLTSNSILTIPMQFLLLYFSQLSSIWSKTKTTYNLNGIFPVVHKTCTSELALCLDKLVCIFLSICIIVYQVEWEYDSCWKCVIIQPKTKRKGRRLFPTLPL